MIRRTVSIFSWQGRISAEENERFSYEEGKWTLRAENLIRRTVSIFFGEDEFPRRRMSDFHTKKDSGHFVQKT